MADKPTVIEALARVMEDVRAVAKGDRNQQQGYQFRGIDAIMNAVGPVLRRHGVVVMPHLEEVHYRDVQTSQGKPSRECTVTVRYRFHGPAGDYLDCVTPGESMDFGDKGAPKAMSVAYRIALLQALCLPTQDADPDSQNYERAPSDNPASDGVELAPGEARAQLAHICAAKQLDVAAVAAYYEDRLKRPLATETNVESITGFAAALRDGKVTIPALEST